MEHGLPNIPLTRLDRPSQCQVADPSPQACLLATKVDARHQVVLAGLPEQVRSEACEFAGESGPIAGLLH